CLKKNCLLSLGRHSLQDNSTERMLCGTAPWNYTAAFAAIPKALSNNSFRSSTKLIMMHRLFSRLLKVF
ncbi:MAG: hypothetical protein K8F24_07600, partial [Bacteroidales bacterium]|nr:hypothetical protein [Bacteroidales bacterium]